jgi:glc operon protein GlcG
MLNRLFVTFAAGVAVLLCASGVSAQLPNPYGSSITLESARKAAAPALAEAQKNNWRMAVAVVDISGDLVFFEKMDGTQAASVNIAVDKARSAARFKRPTKALQDALAAGGAGLRLLALEGAVPVEGGLPLIADGKIVGAIGVSGGTSEQDGQCAKAGSDSVK